MEQLTLYLAIAMVVTFGMQIVSLLDIWQYKRFVRQQALELLNGLSAQKIELGMAVAEWKCRREEEKEKEEQENEPV